MQMLEKRSTICTLREENLAQNKMHNDSMGKLSEDAKPSASSKGPWHTGLFLIETK